MIAPDTIEKILSLTKIEEVIGDFVSLRRAGASYKGCCPFHDEKTPSFVVSPAKGIYKCFGCGKAGNAISFIMEYEKCSYSEAIRFLGNKYRVEIIETEISEEEKQKRDIRESLQIINQYAADYFEKELWETDEGKSIGLSYFLERGFSETTIKNFRLGYSPQKKDKFTIDAEKAGYKLEYLQKIGLSSVGENYKIDRFHGRVMFPIMSISGSIIGFGGRIMTPANEHVASGAKYVNSPESEIYNKSKTLYGISLAKNEIVRKEECILVEGYTDVISLHQAGITNVVASSGTSLTEDQINLIKRFTENILIVYDGDNAGIKASTRGIDMILEKDMNVRVLLLPNGEDPDTFAKKHSSEEITEYIKTNKTDFLTFRIKTAAEETKNDPIERAKFITSIANTIAKIQNSIKRSVFIQECGKILNIDESSLTNQISSKLGQAITQKPQRQATIEPSIKRIDKILENEKDIIRILILFGRMNIEIPDADVLFEANKSLAKRINNEFNFENYKFSGTIQEYISQQLSKNNIEILNKDEKIIFDEYFTHIEEKGDKIVDYLRDFIDAKRIADIMSDNSLPDYKYWQSSKFNTEQDEELLPSLLKETLLEYIKRRFEVLKEELCKKQEKTIDDFKKIQDLSICIDIISKQMHHNYR